MFKRLKFYAVLTVIVGLAVTALYYRHLAHRHTGHITRTVDPAALVRQIEQLSELVSVRYTIQKVIGLKEEKVPFGSESVLLLVQGNALGGVNLSNVVVELTATNALTVRLPAAEILHVYINEKETQVWDRSKTWWTPWVGYSPQLEQQARQAALDAVREAAQQMGILSNAQHNAEITLRKFLAAAGFQTVRFSSAK